MKLKFENWTKGNFWCSQLKWNKRSKETKVIKEYNLVKIKHNLTEIKEVLTKNEVYWRANLFSFVLIWGQWQALECSNFNITLCELLWVLKKV